MSKKTVGMGTRFKVKGSDPTSQAYPLQNIEKNKLAEKQAELHRKGARPIFGAPRTKQDRVA